MVFNGSRAFTLLELLVVVAIIGTLTAIAIPNFLRAQAKAKLAHTQKDLGSLHNTLSLHALDNPAANNRNADPFQAYLGTSSGNCAAYMVLTTPINFVQNMRDVEDIFYRDPEDLGFPPFYPLGECYSFYSSKTGRFSSAAVGRGPDSFYEQQLVFPLIQDGLSIDKSFMFDPTNGIYSRGDLVKAPGATYIER